MTTPHAQRGATQPAIAPVAADRDLLFMLMTAQFALQNNDLAGAAKGFTEASVLCEDPKISEEATHLALAVKDWPLAEHALMRWQQLAPRDTGVPQARAWIALGQQRSDAAYTDLKSLAAQGNADAWRLIAQVLLNAPDKTMAAHLLERLATPPQLGKQQNDWIAASQLAFALGDKAQAQHLADTTVTRFHGDEAYMWSARLAIDRGDKSAARAAYAEALRHVPGNPRLRSGYAVLLADGGDNAGAARVLAGGAQDDTTYGARAAYMVRANNKAALNALYHEVLADKSPRDGRRLYLLGQIAEMIGRREEALSWYRAVGDDDEHGFDARMREATVLNELGRTEQAMGFLQRLENQAGVEDDARNKIWLLEADILMRKDRSREALAIYTRALEGRPDEPRFLYMRGLLLVESGDMAAGERDLRRVIEIEPNDAGALNALGYTLADGSHKGDPQQREALDLIQRALKLKPEEPAIIDSMGWVHYRMGDLDAALQDLRRAYAKQPDADIAAHLGEVLWMKGKHEEARKVWDEGRKKDAKNKTLLEAIRRLTT
ncbi:MAG: tetratricopeptide repeat protein [Rhodanobacter sp.]|nr:tetratricopeptide repeat protein [Rhodanobacter sp.]